MRGIKYSRSAEKDLLRLPAKNQRQIAQKLTKLAELGALPSAQKLSGRLEEYCRLRVGEFRVIYREEGDHLIVVAIGKRNDDEVYRAL